MATDTAERKATRSSAGQVVAPPPPEPEHLPCPRCDSTNTKFCYYNNYNFSQPRHFCKSCRRYWTHGGTLRDIPVGGGSRKNAKRSRTTAATGFSSSHGDFRGFPGAAASQLLVPGGAAMCGSFTSLLNTQGTGIWALGGFGFGIGPGLDDVGFGLGRTVWPFAGVGDGGPSSGGSSVGVHTWGAENGDQGGFVGGGDCFAFPELAISTPGGSLMK